MEEGAVQEREDIIALGEDALRDIVRDPPQGPDARRFAIRMTSGTTGRAPIVIANEHPEHDARAFDGFHSVILAKGTNNTRLSNTLIIKEQSTAPIRIIAIDEGDVCSENAGLFSDLRIDAIAGFISFVRLAAEHFGEALSEVRMFKFSGEKWTRTHADAFERDYPLAQVAAYYITNEIGVMASTECRMLPFSHYHAEPGVLIEINQPDDDGVGDILVSKFFCREFKALRYRTGDIARFAPSPCKCGRPAFELIGRRGADYIKIAGALLIRDEFDRVAALCSDLFDDYRVEAGTGTRGSITLIVYRRDGQWSDSISQAISDRVTRTLFLTQTRTLKDLIADGYFEPLVVQRAAEPFPRKHKEVKLSIRS